MVSAFWIRPGRSDAALLMASRISCHRLGSPKIPPARSRRGSLGGARGADGGVCGRGACAAGAGVSGDKGSAPCAGGDKAAVAGGGGAVACGGGWVGGGGRGGGREEGG